MEKNTNSKIMFGIDLGTTNSCASYLKGDMPHIVQINGQNTVPSCILLSNGEYTVGKLAYDQRYSESVIYSVKRRMGEDITLPITDFITGEVKTLTPTEASSLILKHIKEESQKQLGYIDEVTITVPAYFSPIQKQETLNAAKMAGFQTVYIINEPTSAAIAHQLIEKPKGTERVMIFDLGGGTFDVSVVSILEAQQDTDNTLEGMYQFEPTTANSIVKVIATDGSTTIGGDDVDKFILRKALFQSSRTEEKLISFPKEGEVYETALLTIERYKKRGVGGTFYAGDYPPIKLTEDDLRSGYFLCLNMTKKIVERVLSQYSDITRIILVGGSTKSPYVKEFLEQFGIPVQSSFEQDLIVSLGACVNTASRNGAASVDIFDIATDTISIETTSDFLPIIIKGDSLPAKGNTQVKISNGKTANIKMYLGVDGVNLLGTLTLTPQSTTDIIDIQLTLSLDNILTVKATSKDKKVEAEIELNQMQKTGLTQEELIHKKRLGKLKQYNHYCTTFVSDIFKYADKAELIEQYESSESKDEFYSSNKTDFAYVASKYKELMNNTAENNFMYSNTGKVGEATLDTTPQKKSKLSDVYN